MLGTHDLWLFILSGLLLNVTPGPDTFCIVAAIGLSALLAASATAFTVVKILGALYLLYLGISLLFSPQPRTTHAAMVHAARLPSVFLQGFLTNVLNPRVALFFLALLPQFVETDAPSKALALLFLGLIFDGNGTLWNLLVAWSAARMGKALRGHTAVLLERSLGALFVFLAARLALSRNG